MAFVAGLERMNFYEEEELTLATCGSLFYREFCMRIQGHTRRMPYKDGRSCASHDTRVLDLWTRPR